MRRAPFGAVQWNTRTLASFLVSRASVLCAGAYKVLYLAEGCSRNSYIKVGQKRESWRVVWLAPYSLRAMAAIAGAASSKKLRYPQ